MGIADSGAVPSVCPDSGLDPYANPASDLLDIKHRALRVAERIRKGLYSGVRLVVMESHCRVCHVTTSNVTIIRLNSRRGKNSLKIQHPHI